jgi:ATP-dependent Clp protease protease subunit
MSKKALPLIENFQMAPEADFAPRPQDVENWDPTIKSVVNAQGETVIDILDTIGADFFSPGVTSLDVSQRLKGASDVSVNINSPGGLFSEGNAIYNLLVQHRGKVTVNIIGLAASAAAIIAMAGDEVRIAPSAFFFIHNAQVTARGDRHALGALTDDLEKLDRAIAEIFQARSKKGIRQIQEWLDAETMFSAAETVNNGFADSKLRPGDVISNSLPERKEIRNLKLFDAVFAEKGFSRARRREMLSAIKTGTPEAANLTARDAGLSEVADALARLNATLGE